MKFGREEDDSDNGHNERYQPKKSTSSTKLTSTSSFKTGCIFIGAIVFYLISYIGGPIISTLLIIPGLYIFVEKISVFKERNRNYHEENTESTVAKLQLEKEKYRQESDRTLEKLSSLKTLKTDNENLKSQIERQTYTSNKLLDEIAKLKIEQKTLKREKLGYEHDLIAEKDRSRREFASLNRKLEEESDRYKKTIENLKEEINKLRMEISTYIQTLNTAEDQKRIMEMKIAQLSENLNQAQNERVWIENQAKAAILKEQETVQQYKQTFKTAQQKYIEMETKLKKSKDELKKLQDAQPAIDTVKALELARKELSHMKAENERLKQHVSQESEAPVCNICEDRPRNAYLDPCGHTLCMVCATEVRGRNNKCPVCRERIHKIGQLYFS